jgi:hypothetical protein
MPLSQDPRRPFRRGFAALALTVGLILAGCGSNGPSLTPPPVATAVPTAGPSTAASSGASPGASSGAGASPGASADVGAIYDTIEKQVQDIRGLPAKKPVPRQFITTTELKQLLTDQFDKDAPPAYVAASERLYKALGLIPPDSSLKTQTLDLLGGGVVAFYDDEQGKLYVTSNSGTAGGPEKFYFSHEYDHALQDQNFTVFKDQKGILDQTDRLLARQAVYEGDATLLMTQWAAGNLTPAELAQIIAGSADPQVQAVLSRAPKILSEPLQFPYTTGFGFINQVNGAGGWQAVDGLYANLPQSTEQILHPEKYQAHEAPVAITLPADLTSKLGSGWTIAMQDTFGELQTGIWLKEGGVPAATADAAAAGWGGDRLAVLNGPNDAWAVVMDYGWDTDADAAQFESAATTALAKAQGSAKVLPGTGGKTRWVVVGSDDATLNKVANALGLAG